MTQKLVPAARLARLLGVPAAFLRSEAEQGRLPHLRAGRQLLFDHEVVASILIERARREGLVTGTHS